MIRVDGLEAQAHAQYEPNTIKGESQEADGGKQGQAH